MRCAASTASPTTSLRSRPRRSSGNSAARLAGEFALDPAVDHRLLVVQRVLAVRGAARQERRVAQRSLAFLHDAAVGAHEAEAELDARRVDVLHDADLAAVRLARLEIAGQVDIGDPDVQ